MIPGTDRRRKTCSIAPTNQGKRSLTVRASRTTYVPITVWSLGQPGPPKLGPLPTRCRCVGQGDTRNPPLPCVKSCSPLRTLNAASVGRLIRPRQVNRLAKYGISLEPSWGIEPQTYVLREARHSVLDVLPAQIAAHASRNALGAQRARIFGPRPGPRTSMSSGNRVLLA
jgi:hypothetical protein